MSALPAENRATVLTALKNAQKKENKKPAIKSNEYFNCREEGPWTNNGYCYTCHEEGNFTKDCPYYDSGSEEKRKAQRIKTSACYTCVDTGHWTKNCLKLGELIQYSDIEEDELPKKVMKITKERKRGARKPKKEDWDEELKKQQNILGRMKELTTKTSSLRNLI